MEIGKLIKKCLCVACVCFTLLTALYMLIMVLHYPDDESVPVEASRVVLFFVFSLLFAIANTILSIKQLNGALRYILHYVICVFGFYSCLILPSAPTTGGAIIMAVLFTFVYVIVMAIIGLFKAKLKKNREVTDTYTKQFSTKK